MAYRICSECPNDLKGKPPQTKTCGPACRSKRSRRLKRQHKERGLESAMPDHQKEITERVKSEIPDVAHHIIEEEIRPVVRESITADTLRAIAEMVALTPDAVTALREDLASEDSTIRQRAYTLLLKYTVGHQAIVRPPEEDPSKVIEVNFELPRPDDSPPTGEEVVVEATEVKVCDTCAIEKPVDQFVANSLRCVTCHEAQAAQAAKLLDPDAD